MHRLRCDICAIVFVGKCQLSAVPTQCQCGCERVSRVQSIRCECLSFQTFGLHAIQVRGSRAPSAVNVSSAKRHVPQIETESTVPG